MMNCAPIPTEFIHWVIINTWDKCIWLFPDNIPERDQVVLRIFHRQAMPSSQLILELLARSVAKVNSEGERKEGMGSGKGSGPGSSFKFARDSMVSLDTAKVVDQNGKQGTSDEKTSSSGKCDTMVWSLVFNHLKKVSPILAEQFGSMFPCLQNPLTLQDVINHYGSTAKPNYLSRCKAYAKVQNKAVSILTKTCITDSSVKKNMKGPLRTNKQFTPKEDEVINIALKKADECDQNVNFCNIAKQLQRGTNTVRKRAELLKRTGGKRTMNNYTLIEDQIIIETLVIPRLSKEKLPQILMVGPHYTESAGLSKKLRKSQNGTTKRWEITLHPWLLQHYSGTLNMRVERMLINHIADTYPDFSSIDWSKVAAKSEFVGHTQVSLRGICFNIRDKTKNKFKTGRKEVSMQDMTKYCELVYCDGRPKASSKLERQKEVIDFFKRKVEELGIKDFL